MWSAQLLRIWPLVLMVHHRSEIYRRMCIRGIWTRHVRISLYTNPNQPVDQRYDCQCSAVGLPIPYRCPAVWTRLKCTWQVSARFDLRFNGCCCCCRIKFRSRKRERHSDGLRLTSSSGRRFRFRSAPSEAPRCRPQQRAPLDRAAAAAAAALVWHSAGICRRYASDRLPPMRKSANIGVRLSLTE